jgi:hypothetical protein
MGKKGNLQKGVFSFFYFFSIKGSFYWWESGKSGKFGSRRPLVQADCFPTKRKKKG